MSENDRIAPEGGTTPCDEKPGEDALGCQSSQSEAHGRSSPREPSFLYVGGAAPDDDPLAEALEGAARGCLGGPTGNHLAKILNGAAATVRRRADVDVAVKLFVVEAVWPPSSNVEDVVFSDTLTQTGRS